jgi:hypothetical protein
MSAADRHILIFATQNAQQAVDLKDHLCGVGVEAWVLGHPKNTEAAKSNPFAHDAKVVVAERNVAIARQIAEEFLSGRANGTGRSVVDVQLDLRDRAIIEAWPTCPNCKHRRQAICPICETAGADFPLADEVAEPHDDDPLAITSAIADDADPLGRKALLCPMCDEPFVPEYLRRCEWCGHDFGHGAELPEAAHDDIEPINWRVWTLIGVLAALGALIVIYANFYMGK